MIDFVEELPMEWQSKWDDMRLKSGWDFSIRKLVFNAVLVFSTFPSSDR
jgi:hypothetical protein